MDERNECQCCSLLLQKHRNKCVADVQKVYAYTVEETLSRINGNGTKDHANPEKEGTRPGRRRGNWLTRLEVDVIKAECEIIQGERSTSPSENEGENNDQHDDTRDEGTEIPQSDINNNINIEGEANYS